MITIAVFNLSAFDTEAAIVGITEYLIQITNVFAIADRFRARGQTVALSRPLANLLPEECRSHCDVLFEGEAEYTWPGFCRAYAEGRQADDYNPGRENPFA